MHTKTGAMYDIFHYIIGPATVISSSVAVVSQFANVGTSNCTDGETVWTPFNVVVIVFAVLSSIFSGLQTFFRFDKISTQHKTVATKYECLQRDIEEQLSYSATNNVNVAALRHSVEQQRGNPCNADSPRVAPQRAFASGPRREREEAYPIPMVDFIANTKRELATLAALNLSIPMCIVNRYVDQVKELSSTLESVLTPLPSQHDKCISDHDEKGDDFQDEYTEAIRRRLEQQRSAEEMYQLNRLATGFTSPSFQNLSPPPPPV